MQSLKVHRDLQIHMMPESFIPLGNSLKMIRHILTSRRKLAKFFQVLRLPSLGPLQKR